MKYSPLLAIPFALSLIACATEIDSPVNGDVSDGSVDSPDGGPGDGPDGGPGTDASVCLSDSAATAGGEAEALVSLQEEGETAQVVEISMDVEDTDAHILVVELWEEGGPFEDGLKTGTFSISGDEASLAECSVCVFLESEDVLGGALMASSGMVTVTAVSTTVGSQVSVGLEGVSFREIAIDEATETVSDVSGGCSATLASAQLSATLGTE